MPKNVDHAKIRRALVEQLTVPLWPTAGHALGIGRNATFEGAKNGEIPTLKIGRRRPVPTFWLRQQLGIEDPPQPDSEAPRSAPREDANTLMT
jgi:hypothetical protein